MWFQATKTGRFHIFCAEYCGTLHSGMTGWVEVMEPTDYQKWLAGGGGGSLGSQGGKVLDPPNNKSGWPAGAKAPLPSKGKNFFQNSASNPCHTNDATGRGPVL